MSYTTCTLTINQSSCTPKTELIWFGLRLTRRRLAGDNHSFSIGSVVVKSVDVVRDLGVLLNSELTMKQHISHIVSVGYYHLRRLRQLRATPHKTP